MLTKLFAPKHCWVNVHTASKRNLQTVCSSQIYYFSTPYPQCTCNLAFGAQQLFFPARSRIKNSTLIKSGSIWDTGNRQTQLSQGEADRPRLHTVRTIHKTKGRRSQSACSAIVLLICELTLNNFCFSIQMTPFKNLKTNNFSQAWPFSLGSSSIVRPLLNKTNLKSDKVSCCALAKASLRHDAVWSD